MDTETDKATDVDVDADADMETATDPTTGPESNATTTPIPNRTKENDPRTLAPTATRDPGGTLAPNPNVQPANERGVVKRGREQELAREYEWSIR